MVKKISAKKKQSGTEWVGGLAEMPMLITGEGEPYHPEALLWIDAKGLVQGSTMGRPGQVLELANESLEQAITSPMQGRPAAPSRLRVASAELAELLRSGPLGLEVVCAPTPELDEILDAMRGSVDQQEGWEPPTASADTASDTFAGFYRAAATLYRAQPWKIVPNDECLFLVSIEKLGVREMAVSVIGQAGQSQAMIMFASVEQFENYQDAALAMAQGEKTVLPALLALNFEQGADISASMRKQIAAKGWEVAGPNAYPWLMALDAGRKERAATSQEMTRAEAIALALPIVLGEKRALYESWAGEASFERTVSVSTHQGAVDVMLRASGLVDRSRPSDPLMTKLFELTSGEEETEADEQTRHELQEQLLKSFYASPEAQALSDKSNSSLLMEFGATHLGLTLPMMGPDDLGQILFELIPAKVAVQASDARTIVEEFRAFYTFLKREHGLKQADRCLRLLGDQAIVKLQAALSNTRKFGMGKSLLMGSPSAGSAPRARTATKGKKPASKKRKKGR